MESRLGAEDDRGETTPVTRRDTLEVPPPTDHGKHTTSYTTRPTRSATESSQTPTIVIYADPEELDAEATIVHAPGTDTDMPSIPPLNRPP